jgi:ParB family transcriptional regulator, chromosome partitioning protein
MSTKRRGLGRSLEALLGDIASTENPDGVHLEGELKHIALSLIQRGQYQPRKDFSEDSLNELTDSVRAQGIIQPIIVRSIGDNHYEIVAGERRFRAAQKAGFEKIPALIRELPNEAALAMALIENLQRKDLNPIEEGSALKRLIDEFSMTHEQVAKSVGKSRSSITNHLRLLTLPDDVKYLLEQGQLDMGHARTILGLPEDQQSEIAKIVALRGLSVREAELFCKAMP